MQGREVHFHCDQLHAQQLHGILPVLPPRVVGVEQTQQRYRSDLEGGIQIHHVGQFSRRFVGEHGSPHPVIGRSRMELGVVNDVSGQVNEATFNLCEFSGCLQRSHVLPEGAAQLGSLLSVSLSYQH